MKLKSTKAMLWSLLLCAFLLLQQRDAVLLANSLNTAAPLNAKNLDHGYDDLFFLEVAPACATMVKLKTIMRIRVPESGVDTVQPVPCQSLKQYDLTKSPILVTDLLKMDRSPSFWTSAKPATGISSVRLSIQSLGATRS